MGDAGLAMSILTALLFGIFIVWGRSASGQERLRQTFGEPPVRNTPPKSRSTANKRSGNPGRTPSRASAQSNSKSTGTTKSSTGGASRTKSGSSTRKK